jgi:hypothetical protein
VIDDLYESCVDVLEFTKELLVAGSILLFDDYNQIGPDNNSGERRALIEFEKQNPNFVKALKNISSISDGKVRRSGLSLSKANSL